MKILFPLISALAFTALSASASMTTCPTTNLDTYIASGFTCTSGNLLFSNFTYTGTASGNAAAIPAANVAVTPLTQIFNEGFQFSAVWNVTGVNNGQDSLIQFTVTALSGYLTDLHLSFNGSVTGGGNTNVTENYCLGGPVAGCPMSTAGQLLVTNPPPAFSDATFFNGVTTVSVSKDIQVNSGSDPITTQNPFNRGSISSVTNTFSQVPEPATLGMFGVGLIGLGLLRRRMTR